MVLSEMAIRHARITGIDYTLGDSDGLTLNVMASGGKSGFSVTTGRASRSACPWVVTRKLASKKRVPVVMKRVPWLPKASIPMSTVNSSAVLFVLRQSIPSRPCSISGWSSAG